MLWVHDAEARGELFTSKLLAYMSLCDCDNGSASMPNLTRRQVEGHCEGYFVIEVGDMQPDFLDMLWRIGSRQPRR